MTEPTNGELNIMLVDLKEILVEIKSDGKETKAQAYKTNGRVGILEEWSVDARKLIENNAKDIGGYKGDRRALIAGASIFLLLGGTIIALSVTAINHKIKDGIETAMSSGYDKVIIDNN